MEQLGFLPKSPVQVVPSEHPFQTLKKYDNACRVVLLNFFLKKKFPQLEEECFYANCEIQKLL